ncbi:MAG: ATP-dependent DNA ligase, partial [Candidatus Woesearchaeota archaeon]
MNYSTLVEVYERLEATTKRLEKTRTIAEFLKTASDLQSIMLLLQGRVYPNYDERKIGVAAKLVMKSISFATGTSQTEVEKKWKSLGDLGDTAKELVAKKKQKTLFKHELTVKKVHQNLTKLSQQEGKGSVDQKMNTIAELLTSAEPLEAKYIVRTILEELRIGVADGVLRDAIVWANFGEDFSENGEISDRDRYNKYVAVVQEAYDMCNDFAKVAEAAKKGLEALGKINLTVGVPIKVMLALKVRDIKEGFERVGIPAAIEYKYDGFRMQIHKKDKIQIFTRRLEEVTDQFPEVAEHVKNNIKGDSFIIDSEAVGYDSKSRKYLPFQNISQRIKRKYNIKDLSKKMPVELNIFDIVQYDGKSLVNEKFSERRKILEKNVREEPFKIVLAKNMVATTEEEVQKFFEESLAKGNEGIMFKALSAPYKPGARVGYMCKLKPTIDTIDVVVVKAEWGEGKRSSWLSSYTIACRDEDGNLLEIGKVSTGLKEKPSEGESFEEMTELLKP